MGFLKGFLNPSAMRWTWAALAALTFTACVERDYDNPFLADDAGVEDSWREDRDGNGISDSVEFHARDCRATPAECLRIAREVSFAKAQAGLPKGPVDSVTPPADAPIPSKDTAAKVPPRDTVIVVPPKDTTIKVPPKDTTIKVPPKDTTIKVPPKDTVPKVPPKDTIIPIPPRDTTIKVPPKDTIIPVPPKDTIIPVPPKDTVIPVPPKDTVIVVPPIDIPIPPVIAVTGIQATAVYLPVGVSRVTPAVTVLPRDAKQQGYTLTSRDESIVKVSGIDLVPVKPGQAKVEARSVDGGFTTEFTATVLLPDTNVYEEEVSVAPMEMTVGDAPRAPAIVWKPATTSNQGYSLTSGNPSVVKVVAEGGVDRCGPVAAGEATLTLRTRAKGLVAVFKVTVRPAPVRVESLSTPNLTLVVGEKAIPVIAFLPPDADDRGYTLASSKPEVAKVDGSGILAVKKGNAEFTVTSRDGGKTHVFKVKVQEVSSGDDDDGDDGGEEDD